MEVIKLLLLLITMLIVIKTFPLKKKKNIYQGDYNFCETVKVKIVDLEQREGNIGLPFLTSQSNFILPTLAMRQREAPLNCHLPYHFLRAQFSIPTTYLSTDTESRDSPLF